MTFQSGGVLVKNYRTLWQGTPATWNGWPGSEFFYSASYTEMYRKQLWVGIVVDKRAKLTARLPFKVYERSDKGRPEARDHPYAALLRNPNTRQSPFAFWLWVSSTFDIYGEAIVGKVRDRGGRPVQLVPLHPTRMRVTDVTGGRAMWEFQGEDVRVSGIPDEDLIVFRTYNPESVVRGLSPLEKLRATLENEDAARRATSAMWRNGARPSFALKHPGKLSTEAGGRLRENWQNVQGGVENTAKTAILEEGMEPVKLTLNAEELQYIETRRLSREETVAAYDMPPPAVHILDRATFSNITEQMRSIYRDTMATHLKGFESEMEKQLRASVRPGASEPDFGGDVYGEFLMDEVLRGSFEERQEAYQKAEYMTLEEKRDKENLPFIEGTDRIIINSTGVPLDMLDAVTQARTRPKLPSDAARSLMGRLSRQKSLDEVDIEELVAGLNGAADTVRAEFYAAKAAGEDVAGLRARILGKEQV